MAIVLVTGASGLLGREVVPQLAEAGHTVRQLIHRLRPARSGADDRLGDLRTGEGLERAVEGAGAVIHCATSPFRTRAIDVEGTERLLGALASTAPSAHLVYISIVGIDDHPYYYYRAKSAAERLIQGSSLPWSIQRATQFHEFILRFLRPSDRLPFVVVPGGLRFQPMAAAEAARRLVEIVDSGASGNVPDISGPEVHDTAALAHSYRLAVGKAPRVIGLPLYGRAAAAFRRGGHILPVPHYGRQTWQEFLAQLGPRTDSPARVER